MAEHKLHWNVSLYFVWAFLKYALCRTKTSIWHTDVKKPRGKHALVMYGILGKSKIANGRLSPKGVWQLCLKQSETCNHSAAMLYLKSRNVTEHNTLCQSFLCFMYCVHMHAATCLCISLIRSVFVFDQTSVGTLQGQTNICGKFPGWRPSSHLCSSSWGKANWLLLVLENHKPSRGV